MHEPAKEGVFLGRPADDGHRPDSAFAMPDMLNPHHREVVLAGVVAEVVAKGTFGLGGSGHHRALDHKVGISVDARPAWAADHRDPMAGEHARKGQLRQALRQRHHCRRGHRWRPTHKDSHLEWLAASQGRGVMHADPTVQLVVQADFLVGLVVIARELHPVHAEVAAFGARAVGVFGVDRRQRDKRPAISRPADHARQLGDARLVGHHRPPRDTPGERREGIQRSPPITPGPLGSL